MINSKKKIMVKQNEILSKIDLAKKLNCHLNSITNWERKGLIKGHRLGRRVYYAEHEVLNAMGIQGVSVPNATIKAENQ
jgi:hypothetical protein